MAKDDVQLTVGVDPSGVKEGMSQAAARTEAGASKMKQDLDGIGESLEHVGRTMSNAFKTVGLTIAFEAISKIGEKLEQLADRAIEIRNMSEVLQVTGMQFQGMGEAAEEAGVETGKLFQATEKLVQLLAEARAGSAAAIDKLFALGVTLDEIHDPAFGTADMLALLSERLNGSATATATMLALTKEFGGHTALVAQAIKHLSSDTADWNKEAEKVNALTDYQTQRLQEVGLKWKDLGQWISNASAKLVVFAADVAASKIGEDRDYYGNLTQADPSKSMSRHGGGSASKEGDADIAFAEAKAVMESIKDQIEAVKDGSAEKLALVKAYAAAALEYYGKGEVDAVRAANRAVIAETRKFNEEQERLRKEAATKASTAADKQARDQQRYAQDRVNAVKVQFAETAKYLDEELKLEEEGADQRRDIALEEMAYSEQELQSLADAGALSNAQIRQGQKDLESARFQIASAGLRERIALLSADIVAQTKAKDQLVLLEMLHSRRLRSIELQAMSDQLKGWQNLWANVGSSMQPVIARFLNLTLSLKGLFVGLATAVADSFAQMAAKNIATMITQAAAGKAIRLKEIAGDAKAAAAGAYKAIVGIPYVGPFLAPAAAAVAYGATMAFASAKGGYDIPAGVNPLTQLHEREMVLPKPQADAVREMADGRGRRAPQTKLPGISSGKFFITEKKHLIRALQSGRGSL